jgi:hypothetical protein
VKSNYGCSQRFPLIEGLWERGHSWIVAVKLEVESLMILVGDGGVGEQFGWFLVAQNHPYAGLGREVAPSLSGYSQTDSLTAARVSALLFH